MNRAAALAGLLLAAPAAGWGGGPSFDATAEDAAFNSSAQLFAQGGRDKLAVAAAFERYLSQYPGSPRRADAEFLLGDVELARALAALKAEAASKKDSAARFLPAKNPAATKAFDAARRAFEAARGERKAELGPTAQYRLGEIAYDARDWEAAIRAFTDVDRDYPKSYLGPEALMGVVYSNLALEQFSQAESNL